jgi:hypothetical protein
MKLRSDSTNLLRAQDLADVIGLIRHHQLTGNFARHLDKPLRPTFRTLARLVRQLEKEFRRKRFAYSGLPCWIMLHSFFPD